MSGFFTPYVWRGQADNLIPITSMRYVVFMRWHKLCSVCSTKFNGFYEGM